MRTIRSREEAAAAAGLLREEEKSPPGVLEAVSEIIEDVRRRGDEAVIDLTERYDGVRLPVESLEVEPAERVTAWRSLGRELREAFTTAESRIASFATRSLADDWEEEAASGVRVGQIHRPVESAGLYVPGGRYPYPSTVLMVGVPAREAGVKRLILCVPPGPEGDVDQVTLAATTLLGECRVFRIGGAQAIAAMAYGTATVPSCSMLAGPGNIYVTAAKSLLSGIVKVDIEAGPSEVAMYIDDPRHAAYAAADALAQLEHDPLSLAAVVSCSAEVLEAVRRELISAKSSEHEACELSTGAELILCSSDEVAVEFLNRLAPEHLELMSRKAKEMLAGVSSAGCVFLGEYSAVALGDYIAGPSHVLPTGGSAAARSGLSAQSFRKTMNTVEYTRGGMEADAETARLFSSLEGLERHGLSLDIRLRGKEMKEV